jgi:hypothetical protein
MSKVVINKQTECWEWQAGMTHDGYGRFWWENRNMVAHKFSSVALGDVLKENEQFDHLCRVRHCVNPAHLDRVSARINVLRGETITARNSTKTHCKNGHIFSPNNVSQAPFNLERNARICRICKNVWNVAYRRRKQG